MEGQTDKPNDRPSTVTLATHALMVNKYQCTCISQQVSQGIPAEEASWASMEVGFSLSSTVSCISALHLAMCALTSSTLRICCLADSRMVLQFEISCLALFCHVMALSARQCSAVPSEIATGTFWREMSSDTMASSLGRRVRRQRAHRNRESLPISLPPLLFPLGMCRQEAWYHSLHSSHWSM